MKQSLSEQKETAPVATPEPQKLNTPEVALTNNTSDYQSLQGQMDALSVAVAEIEDPHVYLVCDRVQKVRGGYRVNIMDIADVRRAK